MLCGEALKVDKEQVYKSLYKREIPTKAAIQEMSKSPLLNSKT